MSVKNRPQSPSHKYPLSHSPHTILSFCFLFFDRQSRASSDCAMMMLMPVVMGLWRVMLLLASSWWWCEVKGEGKNKRMGEVNLSVLFPSPMMMTTMHSNNVCVCAVPSPSFLWKTSCLSLFRRKSEMWAEWVKSQISFSSPSVSSLFLMQTHAWFTASCNRLTCFHLL